MSAVFSARETQHLQGLFNLLASQRHDELERQSVAAVSRSVPYMAEVARVVAHSRFARGNIPAAVEAFRRALRLAPDCVPVMRELAVCHFSAGDLQAASTLLEHCLAADPRDVESLAKAAEIKCRIGAHAEALRLGKQALAEEPLMPEATIACLRAALELGDLRFVEDFSRKVLAEGAAIPGWLNDVATETYSVAPAVSEALVRRALAIAPNDPVLLLHLGHILCDKLACAESARCHEQALLVAPGAAEIYNSYGILLETQGDYPGAAYKFTEALRLNPELAEAHSNLGGVLRKMGRNEEALAAIREAIRVAPENASGYGQLGVVLSWLGRNVDAESGYRQAYLLSDEAGRGKARTDLSTALLATGRHREAAELLSEDLPAGLHTKADWSNYLFNLNYLARTTGASYLKEAVRFGGWLGAAAQQVEWKNARSPERPLRIGFVSADLRTHPVGKLMSALLAKIDMDMFHVHLYANQPSGQDDSVTAELLSRGANFHRIVALSDVEAARLIQGDGIDVLVDASGHTAGNRLGLFSLKPAPLQIAWMGYFASTGLAQIDYVVGDAWVLPEAERQHFIERPILLPDSYYAYRIPEGAPDVSVAPAQQTGELTFGCFNNRAKITDEVLRCWSSVLSAVPNSRLLVKAKELGGVKERDLFISQSADSGIDPARVVVEGGSPWAEYLAAFRRVDIALDTFPFAGGLTSLDGLWMGVPVLTLKGTRFIAHQGEMILGNLGLSDWIAKDVEGYVHKARGFAARLDELSRLRATLRERMRASPICDSERFARSFENGVREAWVRWCRSE